MSFWMQEPYIKTRLRMVSRRTRVLLSGVLLITVAGSVYSVIICPKKLQAMRNGTIIKKSDSVEVDLVVLQKQHKELKAACDNLIKKYSMCGHEYVDQHACIEALFAVIKKTNLVCHRFMPSNEDEFCGAMNVVLRGSYTNMVAFFIHMAEQSLPIVVIQFDIQAVAQKIVQMNMIINMGKCEKTAFLQG